MKMAFVNCINRREIMKKYLSVSIVLVIALFAILLINKQEASNEHVMDSAKLPYYANAKEVFLDSALIIEAIKLSEEAISYPLGDGITDDFTISYVEVKKVIKTMDGKEIKEGDILQILESEWVDAKARQVHHVEGYTKMKDKKKYTLYLGYNETVDNYYPVGLLYGKIPFDEKEDKVYGGQLDPHISKVVEELRKTSN
jgi:hypothetical protein